MTSVTVIGAGARARAISRLAEKAGALVQLVATDAREPIAGDLVVLAMPFADHEAVIEAYSSQLAGKIVLDIAEPRDPRTHEHLLAGGSSGAEMLARALPDSTVVKAFTAIASETLVAAATHQATTTVLVVGDDRLAKQKVMRLAGVGGIDVLDDGPLARARELERRGLAEPADPGVAGGPVPA